MTRRRSNDAIKRAEKLGAIKREADRERDRHLNKMQGLARQRDVLGGVADSSLRAAKLAKIASDHTEEQQRHKAKMVALQLRRWKAWQ